MFPWQYIQKSNEIPPTKNCTGVQQAVQLIGAAINEFIYTLQSHISVKAVQKWHLFVLTIPPFPVHFTETE